MLRTRPNILLVLTDQQRFDTIQALGSSFDAETPHMDELVQAGLTLTNCQCTAPVCSPSRSTLMTGLFPSEAGMPGNLYNPCPPLSAKQPTIGNRMREAGYETIYHGKWHLGGHVRDYGFDYGEECSHDESTRLMASRFWRDRDWIERERPMFHVVSFLDPHDIYSFNPIMHLPESDFQLPWKNLERPESDYPEIPKAKREMWPNDDWERYHKFYAERIEKVDSDIGKLMDDLCCSGLYSNTWIIFASDHGDMAGEQNIPFKGSYMYEGVTHVPLVVVPPRSEYRGDFTRTVETLEIDKGSQNDSLCSLIDVVPTILDIAGLDTDPNLKGKSLLPLLRGERDHDRIVFAEWHNPPIRMARSKDWKYVRYGNGEEELFSLKEDPHESRNLANDSASQQNKLELSKELDAHIAETSDPFESLSEHAFIYNPKA